MDLQREFQELECQHDLLLYDYVKRWLRNYVHVRPEIANLLFQPGRGEIPAFSLMFCGSCRIRIEFLTAKRSRRLFANISRVCSVSSLALIGNASGTVFGQAESRSETFSIKASYQPAVPTLWPDRSPGVVICRDPSPNRHSARNACLSLVSVLIAHPVSASVSLSANQFILRLGYGCYDTARISHFVSNPI